MIYLIKNFFSKIGISSKKELLRLLKASLLIFIPPLMLLMIYVIYNRLDILEAAIGGSIVFLFSILFIRPYVKDLSNLTEYVKRLSLDETAIAPSLSFLSNVEELSSSVGKLHHSWERRRLQLEAMLTENKILLDILPDLLFIVDKNKNIIRTNYKVSELFKKNTIGNNLSQIFNSRELLTIIDDAIIKEEGKSLNLWIEEPLYRYFQVRIEPFPVYSLAGISAIIIMHDITNIKKTEKLMADFVANASHEVRTPLTSIIGIIETLQNEAKDDKLAQENFLKIMQKQADHINNLITDLLSLSKIEQNLHNPPDQYVDVVKLIKEVVKDSIWNKKFNEAIINFKHENDLPQILADAGQMKQVMNNLISNALKYSNIAKIDINVSIEQRNESEFIVISVKDDGEGIAREHIPRLTERFYRVDTARSRKMGGSGLGLAIVKYIIERHKGQLEIISEVGKGSIFKVLLPIS